VPYTREKTPEAAERGVRDVDAVRHVEVVEREPPEMDGFAFHRAGSR
jgi:hypothetical protein